MLVVDDHELFRTALRALLEEEGFEVADAASGAEALATAPTFRPDVVLMDLNMPGISGIEAAERLLASLPEASVLMLTINRDDGRSSRPSAPARRAICSRTRSSTTSWRASAPWRPACRFSPQPQRGP